MVRVLLIQFGWMAVMHSLMLGKFVTRHINLDAGLFTSIP